VSGSCATLSAHPPIDPPEESGNQEPGYQEPPGEG